MHGDEIWDEYDWEAFLRKNDERVDRYMRHLYEFIAENPPPGEADTEALRVWEERLRAFLHARGWRQEEDVLPPLPEEDDDLFMDVQGDPLAEGAGFQALPIWRTAYALTTRVLDWSNTLPGEVKDSTLVQFCSSVSQIPANLAKGHAIGYEIDCIGGNIACVKRSLAAANAALALLQELREAPYLPRPTYRRLYEQTYEVRNAIGLYVLELRERFKLGLD